MKTVWMILGAAVLFLLAFALTVSGKTKRSAFFAGGLGGVSLLCAVNLVGTLTGLSLGLNAVSLISSFLLGVPGVFVLLAVRMLF